MPMNPPAPVTKTDKATTIVKRANNLLSHRWAIVASLAFIVGITVAHGLSAGMSVFAGVLIGSLVSQEWR